MSLFGSGQQLRWWNVLEVSSKHFKTSTRHLSWNVSRVKNCPKSSPLILLPFPHSLTDGIKKRFAEACRKWNQINLKFKTSGIQLCSSTGLLRMSWETKFDTGSWLFWKKIASWNQVFLPLDTSTIHFRHFLELADCIHADSEYFLLLYYKSPKDSRQKDSVN